MPGRGAGPPLSGPSRCAAADSRRFLSSAALIPDADVHRSLRGRGVDSALLIPSPPPPFSPAPTPPPARRGGAFIVSCGCLFQMPLAGILSPPLFLPLFFCSFLLFLRPIAGLMGLLSHRAGVNALGGTVAKKDFRSCPPWCRIRPYGERIDGKTLLACLLESRGHSIHELPE